MTFLIAIDDQIMISVFKIHSMLLLRSFTQKMQTRQKIKVGGGGIIKVKKFNDCPMAKGKD